MNKETLKQLTNAHAWLGLIISGVLMIVFVCGTISFYRTDVILWDQHHNVKKMVDEQFIPPSGIVQKVIDKRFNIPPDHPVALYLPNPTSPVYYVYFEIENEQGQHQRKNLTFNAYTGAEVPEESASNVYLGNMLYRLHIDLLLPFGRELVGIVSLLFFVVLLSGICIHLKKMFSHFYQYRIKKDKDMRLDGHNLIGVSSLPYTLMYALTGVMFNLSIVFQAGFGFTIFQGDIEQLAETAGFGHESTIERSGQAMNIELIDSIIANAEKQAAPNAEIKNININSFGDYNAQLEIGMIDEQALVTRTDLVYQLSDGSFVEKTSSLENPVTGTYEILSSLHFGVFGGKSLQLVFFVLGLACCYLILTGNLIWLEKREANRKQSQLGLRFVKAMTLALSVGCLWAVSLSFVATRFVPFEYIRTDFLPQVFAFGIFASLIHGYALNKAKKAMIQQLYLALALFALCPVYDLFNSVFGLAINSVNTSVVMVNIILLAMAVFCWQLARYYRTKKGINETLQVHEKTVTT